MAKFDWKTLPYDHKWAKNVDSILDPGTLVTWPQHIAEHIVFNRSKIKGFEKFKVFGPGWSRSISDDVVKLIQQANTICNYFPHPDTDLCVRFGYNMWLTKHKPIKVGGYRRNRVTKTGELNITKEERAVVNSVSYEIEKEREKYNKILESAAKSQKPVASDEPVTFRTNKKTGAKGGFGGLADMEKELSGG